MKTYLSTLVVLMMAFSACKKNSVSPSGTVSKQTAGSKQGSTASVTQPNLALFYGNWSWSAQYTNTPNQELIETPASTGVNETLALNSNLNWTQTKNNAVTNSGTWSLGEMMTPAGWPVSFFSATNSKVIDTARYDNFNFDTGFAGSYSVSTDTLIFIGVNTIGTESYIASRVYVKK